MARKLTKKGKRILWITVGVTVGVAIIGITAGCLVKIAKAMPFEDCEHFQLTPTANPSGPINAQTAKDLTLSFGYADQGPQWSSHSTTEPNTIVDLRLTFTWLNGKQNPPHKSITITKGITQKADGNSKTFQEFVQQKFNLLELFPGLSQTTGKQKIRLDCYDLHNKCWLILGSHNFCYFFDYN